MQNYRLLAIYMREVDDNGDICANIFCDMHLVRIAYTCMVG